jgi:hypothetical protein
VSKMFDNFETCVAVKNYTARGVIYYNNMFIIQARPLGQKFAGFFKKS